VNGAQQEDVALSRLGGDSAVALLGQAAAIVLGVVGVVFTTRLIGAEGYGRLALFMGAGQFLYVIGVHWTMAAAVRFGREALTRGADAGRVLGSWLVVVAASLTATVLAIVVVRPLLGSWLGSNTGATVVVVFVLAVVVARVQEHLLLMASLARLQVMGRLLGKLAFCSAVGLLLWRLGPGAVTPEQAVLLIAGSFAIQAISTGPLLRQAGWKALTIDRADVLRIARYSVPFLGRSVAIYLLDWMDVGFLRLLRSTAEIGIYQVAYQWMVATAEGLGAALLPVFPLLTGRRATGSKDSALHYAGRLLPQIAVVWTLLLCALGLLGGPIVRQVLSPAFAAVPRLFSLLLVAVSFQVVFYGALPLLASYDLASGSLGILGAMVALNLAGDLLLVRPFGAFGAALATAATYSVGGVLQAVVVARAFRVRVAPLLIPAGLGLPALAALALSGPFVAQAMVWMASGTGIVVWARKTRVFTAADLALIEPIAMPPWMRGAFRLFYRALGAHA
jgi:O-antigen/teichoic acid export membrane protein